MGLVATRIVPVSSQSSISSEEDADAALKLSSALTQALLAYRIKSVSTVR